MEYYSNGNYPAAIAEVDEMANQREGTGDELMWRLEAGSVNFAGDKYPESIKAFEQAENLINNFENRAEISARDVGNEAGAAATNPNVIPYKSNYSEKILLNAYKALAYMGKEDFPGARVELRRAYNRQKEAEERFQDQIDAAEKEASGKGFNPQHLLSASPEMGQVNRDLDQQANRAYGSYVNPFVTYLSAIGYLLDNNYDEALVDFRNLYKMDPKNPLVQRDLATCAGQSGGRTPDNFSAKPFNYPLNDNICFVIFANGLAPARKEIKIHVPLPPPVGYTGIAFPVLEYYPHPAVRLNICTPADGKNYYTVPVANMDYIFSKEYRSELPIIITRIVVSVLAKETANLAAQYAVKDQEAPIRILVLIAGSLYKYALNRADLRSWQALPGEYQICHFPIPKDRTIVVNGQSLKLKPGTRRAIIHAQMPQPGTFHVRAFEFE